MKTYKLSRQVVSHGRTADSQAALGRRTDQLRRCVGDTCADNDKHLRRLLREYVDYFEHDRIDDALAKDTPLRREVERKPSRKATVISSARLGGLHHRYGWREAA